MCVHCVYASGISNPSMHPNDRQLVALLSIEKYRSIDFRAVRFFLVLRNFHSRTLLRCCRKTLELMTSLAMDSEVEHGRQEDRNASLTWLKHVKRRRAKKLSKR